MPSRGERHSEPAKLVRARRRLGWSQKALASEVDKRLPWTGAITEHIIAKMERGDPVDADRYWPVMVELGLHVYPSLDGPGRDELPGAWLRDLRVSSGIAPARLCAAFPSSEHDSPLGRATLARVEQGTNRKSIRDETFSKIAHAFQQCGVQLQARVLWNAWEREPPAAGGLGEALLPLARAMDSIGRALQ